MPMKRIFPIIMLIVAMITPVSAQLSLDNWSYIQVDKSRTAERSWFGMDMGDLNHDGLADIVSGRWVYLNPGGDMTAKWQRIAFPQVVDGLLILDVDNDNNHDILAGSPGKQWWLEAENASATSWTIKQINSLPICNHNNTAQGSILAQIIPGDTPEIVLTDRAADGGCEYGIWYLKIPSNPNSIWPSVRISTETNGEDVAAGDIDGDGDLDICQASVNGRTVNWYENPGNGTGNWTVYSVGITTDWADRFEMADIDGDGWLDIIVAEGGSDSKDNIWWFEGPSNPKNSAWTRHLVSAQAKTHGLSVADMDSDGDMDVVTGELNYEERVRVWENNGQGVFTGHLVYQGHGTHNSAKVHDMDNDGDLEIMSIGWHDPYLHLWRNDAVTPSVKIKSGQNRHPDGPVRIAALMNPFVTETGFNISLDKRQKVILDLFDVRGAHIANAFHGYRDAGSHVVKCTVPLTQASVIIARFQIGQKIISKNLIKLN